MNIINFGGVKKEKKKRSFMSLQHKKISVLLSKMRGEGGVEDNNKTKNPHLKKTEFHIC